MSKFLVSAILVIAAVSNSPAFAQKAPAGTAADKAKAQQHADSAKAAADQAQLQLRADSLELVKLKVEQDHLALQKQIAENSAQNARIQAEMAAQNALLAKQTAKIQAE